MQQQVESDHIIFDISPPYNAHEPALLHDPKLSASTRYSNFHAAVC
jgi:hypothetical protein